MKELCDDLCFEDRIEYKLDRSKFANRYNFFSVSKYVFLCSALILGTIVSRFEFFIFGFIWYLISKIIDEFIYKKQMKQLNLKYFDFKAVRKKKK